MQAKNCLDFLSIASDRVWSQWMLGGVSELTGIPKKHLRKALRIFTEPKMEAEIFRNGEFTKKTFRYGFMTYYKIEKRKKRKIIEPHDDIQMVYRKIKVWLEDNFESHKNAFGFVKGRNSKAAADELEPLFSGGYHFGFDIADAFPSVTDEMIRETLERLGIDETIAEFLAWFLTYEYHGKRRLPQGASASPVVINLVYFPMCEVLDEICESSGIKWSVYADDFNFAAEHISDEVKERLILIPADFGFSIKPSKNKDNLGKTVPHMLGLTVVGGKLHIKRKLKNKFRRVLYAHKKYGAYSDEVVRGIHNYVGCIYGEKKNWPGWLKI